MDTCICTGYCSSFSELIEDVRRYLLCEHLDEPSRFLAALTCKEYLALLRPTIPRFPKAEDLLLNLMSIVGETGSFPLAEFAVALATAWESEVNLLSERFNGFVGGSALLSNGHFDFFEPFKFDSVDDVNTRAVYYDLGDEVVAIAFRHQIGTLTLPDSLVYYNVGKSGKKPPSWFMDRLQKFSIPNLPKNLNSLCLGAASCGHVSILSEHCQDMDSIQIGQIAVEAATKGRISILKWLQENKGLRFDASRSDGKHPVVLPEIALLETLPFGPIERVISPSAYADLLVFFYENGGNVNTKSLLSGALNVCSVRAIDFFFARFPDLFSELTDRDVGKGINAAIVKFEVDLAGKLLALRPAAASETLGIYKVLVEKTMQVFQQGKLSQHHKSIMAFLRQYTVREQSDLSYQDTIDMFAEDGKVVAPSDWSLLLEIVEKVLLTGSTVKSLVLGRIVGDLPDFERLKEFLRILTQSETASHNDMLAITLFRRKYDQFAPVFEIIASAGTKMEDFFLAIVLKRCCDGDFSLDDVTHFIKLQESLDCKISSERLGRSSAFCTEKLLRYVFSQGLAFDNAAFLWLCIPYRNFATLGDYSKDLSDRVAALKECGVEFSESTLSSVIEQMERETRSLYRQILRKRKSPISTYEFLVEAIKCYRQAGAPWGLAFRTLLVHAGPNSYDKYRSLFDYFIDQGCPLGKFHNHEVLGNFLERMGPYLESRGLTIDVDDSPAFSLPGYNPNLYSPDLQFNPQY